MTESFFNVYDDEKRAAAYSTLEFPGTYYLAYRDLPDIIAAHVSGKSALDFGCGTGRSTRFLKDLGFDVSGIDISKAMIAGAKKMDPSGDYRVVLPGKLEGLTPEKYNLVLAAFTFDNIPDVSEKRVCLTQLHRMMSPTGTFIMIVSTPEIYTHEWASFTTRDFPENHDAETGDRVKIVMLDVPDSRPVEDVLFRDDAYHALSSDVGFRVIQIYRPLGLPDDGIDWISETTVAPWAIYVLNKNE